MLLTPHTAVGVVIGTKISNPVVATISAFLSHYILDRVPHWDFFTNTKKNDRLRGWRLPALMIDFGSGLLIGTSFVLHALWVNNDPSRAVTIFLSAAAANLPDALEAPILFFDTKNKILNLMMKFQSWNQTRAHPFFGLLTQALVLIICGALLLG